MTITDQRIAGRELDAEVAERVFGRAVTRHARGICHKGGTHGFHDDMGFTDTRRPRSDWRQMYTFGAPALEELPEEHFHYGRVPDYSTDTADAWRVAEHCKLLYAFTDSTGSDAGLVLRQSSDEQWEVRYIHGIAMVREATLPLAICIASLAARRVR